MSVIYSENATHRTNLATAEMIKQVAVAGSVDPLIFKNATIAYLRSGLASALANGCSPSVFVIGLRELGNWG
jgi:hypothetical protein